MSERWTPEAVGKLRELAATPVSCATIARTLGPDFTRNMVISKANRSGIHLVGKPADGQWSMRPSKPVITLPGGAQLPQQPMCNGNVARWAKERQGPRKPRVQASSVAADPCGVTMGELRDSPIISQCRWPLGDPKGWETAFCGVEPRDGSPYCSFHHRYAYTTRGTVEP